MSAVHFELDFDVLIIGGGPAGSACAAVLARAGARTAVIERGRFAEFRIGETMDPRVNEPLQRLGLTFEEVAQGRPCLGMTAVWGGSEPQPPQSSIFRPFGQHWRVDRTEWDRRLLRHAESLGAHVFLGANVESASWDNDHWWFAGSCDGGAFSGRARRVVEAVGRKGHSVFAPSHDRIRYDRLIGFAFRFESQSNEIKTNDGSGLDSAWIESIPDGWWYSAELPDGSTLAVLFSDADLIAKGGESQKSRMDEAFGQTAWTARRHPWIERLIGNGEFQAFDARTSMRRQIAAPGWIAAGDALASFDPLSGQGVLEALKSGIATAELLLRSDSDYALGLRAHAERTIARFNRKLVERWRVYSQEPRWSDREFWRRRQSPTETRSGRNPTASAATQA